MRRAFLTSRELFLARLGLPGTLLGVEVQHRDGTVRVLVEAPGPFGAPEAGVPEDEPFPALAPPCMLRQMEQDANHLADKLAEFGTDMLNECNCALPSGDAWDSIVESNGLMQHAATVLRALTAASAAKDEEIAKLAEAAREYLNAEAEMEGLLIISPEDRGSRLQGLERRVDSARAALAALSESR